MSISFNIDSGVFSDVLERLAVKGKHNNGSVLSTSSFNTEFLARFENDTMTIINGDSIWFGQIKIPIANLVCNDDNEFSAEADRLLPFLKSLSGLLSVNIDNHITISNGTKSFSLPKLHLHPHIDAINRIVAMTKAYAYEETLQNLFGFGDTKFEGAFKMSKGDFEGIIKIPTLLDLAAMKAYALGGRAKWKDYVDLYFIIKDHAGLKEISKRAKEIFKTFFNEKLFREQLSYFKDIDDSEKLEYMGPEVKDEAIKEFLINTAITPF